MDNITKIVEYSRERIPLSDAKLSDEYYYNSLAFAIIDAIFSIGANYTSTRNTVIRYCNYYNLKRIRDNSEFPPEDEQHLISELIENMKSMNNFSKKVFMNTQKTSTRNGILKSEAVLEWAKILKKNKIETLQDFNNLEVNDLMLIENSLKDVKGQSSGISTMYLKMLCGSDNYCKPDRHILRFISQCIESNCTQEDACCILKKVAAVLRQDYPNINLRLLDHMIWKFMSNIK